MKGSFSLFQQYISYVLLVSFFLQSCGGEFDNNPLIPIQKEQTERLQPESQQIIPLANIQTLVDQTVTAQGGHMVTCYQENGKLKADVAMNIPQGFSKSYEGVNVYIEQGAELTNLFYLDKKEQENRIHLQLAKGEQPAKVVIYKGAGLMGGMQEGEEEDSSDDGEKEPTLEEWREGQVQVLEGNSEDRETLPIFPPEIWLHILSYATCNELMVVRQVAYSFRSILIGSPELLQTHLLKATKAQETKKIDILMKLGVSLNSNLMNNLKSNDQEALLRLAARDNRTRLHVAAMCGNKHIINGGAQLHIKDEKGYTPLHLAVIYGQLEVVKLLIKQGAKVNAIDKKENSTPLHEAAKGGYLEIAKYLVEKGAKKELKDINKNSPLHFAARSGNMELVKLLIPTSRSGYISGYIKNMLSTKNISGNTPLHWAIREGHLEIVKLLIEKGADVNAKNVNGNTPLHWAIREGHLEIVELLIEKGADVNAKNVNDNTPLHWATIYNQNKAVRLLLQSKVDVNVRNRDNCTPLQIAIKKRYTGLVELLNKK